MRLIYILHKRARVVVYLMKKIQSDKTPLTAFLLVRVRVRRVVLADHVFRVRERVPTDAGFFRAFRRGSDGRFASFFREFFFLDGGELLFPTCACGKGWLRGGTRCESSDRHRRERDSRGKNFEDLSSTSRFCFLLFVLFVSSSSSLSSSYIVSPLAHHVSSFGNDSTGTSLMTTRRRRL